MNASDADHSPLLPQRAFVVQLRAEADIAQGRVTGRVEHVMSGQAARFDSLEELLAFLTQILTAPRNITPTGEE